MLVGSSFTHQVNLEEILPRIDPLISESSINLGCARPRFIGVR